MGVDLFDKRFPQAQWPAAYTATPAGLAGVPDVSDLIAALTKKVPR
jgi:hypothetical protein